MQKIVCIVNKTGLGILLIESPSIIAHAWVTMGTFALKVYPYKASSRKLNKWNLSYKRGETPRETENINLPMRWNDIAVMDQAESDSYEI